MSNDDEIIDSPNDDETPEDDTPIEEVPEGDDTPDDEPDDGDSEDVEELKKQNVKLFERAKKAEGFAKGDDGKWVKKTKPAPKPKPKSEAQKVEITPLDAIALMKAKVTHEDDINEVLDYARFKNISVFEALKSSVVKTTVASKIAERATANATAIRGGKRGASKPEGDELISQAGEGKFPDDPADLAKARIDEKKSKK